MSEQQVPMTETSISFEFQYFTFTNGHPVNNFDFCNIGFRSVPEAGLGEYNFIVLGIGIRVMHLNLEKMINTARSVKEMIQNDTNVMEVDQELAERLKESEKDKLH